MTNKTYSISILHDTKITLEHTEKVGYFQNKKGSGIKRVQVKGQTRFCKGQAFLLPLNLKIQSCWRLGFVHV